MKKTALEKIEAMDDFQVTRCFEKFSQSILSKVDIGIPELLKEVPEGMEMSETIRKWENLPEETISKELSHADGASFARTAMTELAKNPSTSEAVDGFMEDYSDNEMIVDIILVLGGVISVIMLVATSKFEYKNGKFNIDIGGKSPAQVKEAGGVLKTLLGAIPKPLMSLL